MKIIFLVGLVLLLRKIDKPILCAGFYTAVMAMWTIAFNLNRAESFTALLLGIFILTAIRFVLSVIFFWLLSRFDEGFGYWTVLAGGIALAFFSGIF